MSYKKLKQEVKRILVDKVITRENEIYEKYPPEKIIPCLQGLLFEKEEIIKFRAVESIGFASLIMAEKNIENVRILMRKFMWNLNEESGGIGWGSQESMCEVAASIDKIYNEFIEIIVSYLNPESSSFLDHKELHPGVIWGIGRLGMKNKKTGAIAKYVLKDSIHDENPKIKGLSIWAAQKCKIKGLEKGIQKYTKDQTRFTIYENGKIHTTTIADQAKTFLKLTA